MNEIIENVFLVISVILLVVMVVCIYLGWFTEDATDEEVELMKRCKNIWELREFMGNKGTDKMMLMKVKNEGKILVWFEDESVNVLELFPVLETKTLHKLSLYNEEVKVFGPS